MKNLKSLVTILYMSIIQITSYAKEPKETDEHKVISGIDKKVLLDNKLKNLHIKLLKKENIKAVGITLSTSFKECYSKEDIPPFFNKILHEGIHYNVPNRTNQNLMCVFLIRSNSQDLNYIIVTSTS